MSDRGRDSLDKILVMASSKRSSLIGVRNPKLPKAIGRKGGQWWFGFWNKLAAYSSVPSPPKVITRSIASKAFWQSRCFKSQVPMKAIFGRASLSNSWSACSWTSSLSFSSRNILWLGKCWRMNFRMRAYWEKVSP